MLTFLYNLQKEGLMKPFLRVFSFCLVLLFSHQSFSQGMTIGGELTDLDGTQIGEETPFLTDVVVTLYDTAQDGSSLYTETFLVENDQGVSVTKGIFTLNLGQGTTSDNLAQILESSDDLWIEISVDGDVLSRAPFTGSPYVIRDPAILLQRKSE